MGNNPKIADFSVDMDEFFGSEMKYQFTGRIFETVFCQFQFKLFIRKLFRCPLNFTWPTFTQVFFTFLAQTHQSLSILLHSRCLSTSFSQNFSFIHHKNHFKENIIDKDIDIVSKLAPNWLEVNFFSEKHSGKRRNFSANISEIVFVSPRRHWKCAQKRTKFHIKIFFNTVTKFQHMDHEVKNKKIIKSPRKEILFCSLVWILFSQSFFFRSRFEFLYNLSCTWKMLQHFLKM